jgi:hypothetical protein
MEAKSDAEYKNAVEILNKLRGWYAEQGLISIGGMVTVGIPSKTFPSNPNGEIISGLGRRRNRSEFESINN